METTSRKSPYALANRPSIKSDLVRPFFAIGNTQDLAGEMLRYALYDPTFSKVLSIFAAHGKRYKTFFWVSKYQPNAIGRKIRVTPELWHITHDEAAWETVAYEVDELTYNLPNWDLEVRPTDIQCPSTANFWASYIIVNSKIFRASIRLRMEYCEPEEEWEID